LFVPDVGGAYLGRSCGLAVDEAWLAGAPRGAWTAEDSGGGGVGGLALSFTNTFTITLFFFTVLSASKFVAV